MNRYVIRKYTVLQPDKYFASSIKFLQTRVAVFLSPITTKQRACYKEHRKLGLHHTSIRSCLLGLFGALGKSTCTVYRN